MKQLNEDKLGQCNVIIRGICVDPLQPNHENCKNQAKAVLDKITPRGMKTPDPEKMVILGKLVSGEKKAPLILATMDSVENVKIVLTQCAKNLKNFPDLKNIYVTADLTEEEREHRKSLLEKLRSKIREDPSQHWVIRSGTILATEKHIQNSRRKNSSESSEAESEDDTRVRDYVSPGKL